MSVVLATWLLATPIPAAPDSMWYGATWQDADRLDKDFAMLAWATGNILFPCEAWSPNYPGAVDAPINPPPCVMCEPRPSPIPEPSTWLMMLLGLIAICSLRGKTRNARLS